MCSFCNQNKITGQAYQPTPLDVEQTLEKAASDLGERTKNAEIAFFGGSFTAIDRTYMLSLLDATKKFRDKFCGIRISTRPDYIDKEILDILKSYGVTSIELGAQSMSDDVLLANNRGHSAESVFKSSELIKSYGFSLGLQMMLTIERALDTYAQKGYPPEWINQRLQTIRARKELTDAWSAHGVQKGQEYAILTDEVTKAWSGLNTRQYKNLKGLKKENLRDNMSTLELALNMLAEATTTELTKAQNPQGLEENRTVAKQGGTVAGNARKEIEAQTGRPVVTAENASTMLLGQAVAGMIEGVVKDEDDKE